MPEKLALRIVRGHSALLLISTLTACAVTLRAAPEADYPGSATGRIEARTERRPPKSIVPDRRPADALLPGHRVLFSVPAASARRIRSTFLYEIRAIDGVVHIVGSFQDFEMGACVSISGYADGPSRTHWSPGRVKLERSTACEE